VIRIDIEPPTALLASHVMKGLVLAGSDVVVNFAAETHVDRSIVGAAEFVVTNVLGPQTLFDACPGTGVRRVVHIRTDEVYGSIDEG
jgi:dTDP-glucose 4,6-dehydratase